MKASTRLTSLFFALLLAGCASDPLRTSNQAPAPVSDGTTNQTSSDSALSSDSAHSTYPTVTGSDQNQANGWSELNNPNSLLYKHSIYYDFDSFIIKDSYRPMLQAHADFLQRHKNAKLIIQGNTDERGSREYNLALGQKRAEGVRRTLKLLGVSDQQMEAVSFGEEKPKNPASNEDAWSENRRSDLVYEHK